jgi:IgGFc binding protein
MNEARFALIGLLTVGLAALAAASCSAVDEPPGDAGLYGSGGGMGGSTAAFMAGAGGSGNCPAQCSSDLHSVLDCSGNVIQECPPDQGCGETGCVPACEAAKHNKSTIGCDYYSVAPDILDDGTGACFAAFIANTWGSPIGIAIERAGQAFDVAEAARIPSGSGQSLTYAPLPGGKLPAGEVAILFLARFGRKLTSCPAGITPAYTTADASLHGTGIGDAFHIVTSAPVVAYDIYPYGGGQSAVTSATLLIPTTAWDTNYIAVDAFRKSQLVGPAQPSIDIVAMEDETTVTLNPAVPIVGGPGVPAAPAGAPQTYLLKKGQVLQFTQDQELIGSPIQSDKPIGVWGGASCLSIDVADAACDSAHQQIPPVKALGHEYVAVRYRNRFDEQEESPPWRLVGAADGTTLTWDPAPPAGAPTALSLGEVAEFWAPGPFVVKSQDLDHPFYMSAHMTGAGPISPFADYRGDPEFVNVIPPAQYLSAYTFFTDPTYPETNLVVIRKRTESGFHDVSLDCAGTLGGWQAIGGGDYEFARFDLVRGNFEKQGDCDNGRHEMKSEAPFGLAIWGWGSAATGGTFGMEGGGFYSQTVSYAYPAGASIQPINTVVVPPVPE